MTFVDPLLLESLGNYVPTTTLDQLPTTNVPEPTTIVIPGQAQTGAGAVSNTDALAQLQAVFQKYDLMGLSDWAWQQLVSGQSQDQILISMHDQPAYQRRFPYEKAMQQAGLPALSPAEMLATESEYKRVQQQYGVSPSTNPNDYVNLFTSQVSPNEFQNRLDLYHKLRTTYAPYIKQQFEQNAGITNVSDGDLYNLLAGQDSSLAQRYADQTGTPMHIPSFADLQTAEQKAVEQQKALFSGGGEVTTIQPGTSPEEVVAKRAETNISGA